MSIITDMVILRHVHYNIYGHCAGKSRINQSPARDPATLWISWRRSHRISLLLRRFWIRRAELSVHLLVYCLPAAVFNRKEKNIKSPLSLNPILWRRLIGMIWLLPICDKKEYHFEKCSPIISTRQRTTCESYWCDLNYFTFEVTFLTSFQTHIPGSRNSV